MLNVGFVLAKAKGFDTFVMHDVDLLPGDDLGPGAPTLGSFINRAQIMHENSYGVTMLWQRNFVW